MRCLLLLLAVTLGAAAQAGELHKWVDADGHVHYSDKPMDTAVRSEKLNIKSNPAAGAPQKSWADRELEYRQRRLAADEAKAKEEKKQTQVSEAQQNCIDARGNLRTLQEGGRTYRYNDKGERVMLGDDAREQSIAQARDAVARWCK